jgi:hypothetical protein
MLKEKDNSRFWLPDNRTNNHANREGSYICGHGMVDGEFVTYSSKYLLKKILFVEKAQIVPGNGNIRPNLARHIIRCD